MRLQDRIKYVLTASLLVCIIWGCNERRMTTSFNEGAVKHDNVGVTGDKGSTSTGAFCLEATPDSSSIGLWIVIRWYAQARHVDMRSGLATVTVSGPSTFDQVIKLSESAPIEELREGRYCVRKYRMEMLENNRVRIEGIGEGQDLDVLFGNLLNTWKSQAKSELAYYGSLK